MVFVFFSFFRYRGAAQHRGGVQRPDQRPDPGQGEGYAQPSILKPEDIQAMNDDDDDDGGWAGAQEEVDYSAKLDFEDFDDDSQDVNKQKPEQQPKKREQVNEKPTDSQPAAQQMRPAQAERPAPRSAWGEPQRHPHYPDSRHPPGARPAFDSRPGPDGGQGAWPMPHQQARAGPQGQPRAEQGSPSGSPGDESRVDEWHKRRQKQQDEMRLLIERARKRREEEEARRIAEQHAAAHAKLKELEKKRRDSESADTPHSGDEAKQHQDPAASREAEERPSRVEKEFQRGDAPPRSRHDSDSSDTSRSSGSRGPRAQYHPQRDVPPRFQNQGQYHRQQQQHQQPPPQLLTSQAQQQYHQQQLARSPQQHREFFDAPLSVSRPPGIGDPGERTDGDQLLCTRATFCRALAK